ncbi:hypothetical protein HPB52_007013 [Rhipicephalus sanguineus]|uniref:Uncharacterized protein n=1 Tax=Rhipicephalus sanguineus TaxID=34632 RepID=A0A9D4QK54_RHISA|nr:hypothetical protein HPB52_007013 [Rhipicephalus sanguineus]
MPRMRKAFGFTGGKGNVKAKCASDMCGDRVTSTRPGRSHNDDKREVRDKTNHSDTSTSETRMTACHTCSDEEDIRPPLGSSKCNLQSDVGQPHSGVSTGVSIGSTPCFRGTKEGVGGAAKSTVTIKKAPVREEPQQFSHTEAVHHESNKPAVVAPELYIDGVRNSAAEDQSTIAKDGAANVHMQTSPTVMQDVQMLCEVGESTTPVSALLDLAARGVPSNVDKSTAIAASSSYLGADAGARPETGTSRVKSRSKARKGETTHLYGPGKPRHKSSSKMSLHLEPTPPESSSAKIDCTPSMDASFSLAELPQCCKNSSNEFERSCGSIDEGRMTADAMNLCYKDHPMADFLGVLREEDDVNKIDAAFRNIHEKERDLKKRQKEIEAVLEDVSVKVNEQQDVLDRLVARMQRLRDAATRGNHRRGVKMDKVLKPSS